MKKNKRIMIVTGGTGGHIFPGIIISRYLKNLGYSIKWVGSNNRMESHLVPKYNFNIKLVYIPKFSNFKISFFLKNIYFLIKSIFLVCLEIKKWKPNLVIGFGGYISFVGVLSAWLCNVSTFIHEQNYIVGFSNKCLSYIATKILQAFPNSFKNKHTSLVGNPIREELLNFKKPNKRFKNKFNKINILILGGSQGSLFINNIIIKLLKVLDKNKFLFLHQVGFDNINYMHKKSLLYSNYAVIEFIDNIKEAYSWAHLVICRSGALTVSEICAVGLAAIFIPYLHKDRQQYYNAKILENIGAAIILEEKYINENKLANILMSLNHKILLKMATLAYSKRFNNPNKKFLNEIKSILR